jgi:hypothetical protein
MSLHAFLVLAAETAEHETSKVPFYVAGLAFGAWAVILAVLGLRRPAFPGGATGERAVIGISVILALASVTTAVTTAG